MTAEDFQIIAQCDVFRDVESRGLPDALRFLDAYDPYLETLSGVIPFQSESGIIFQDIRRVRPDSDA